MFSLPLWLIDGLIGLGCFCAHPGEFSNNNFIIIVAQAMQLQTSRSP
jgi:hypothetical protein